MALFAKLKRAWRTSISTRQKATNYFVFALFVFALALTEIRPTIPMALPAATAPLSQIVNQPPQAGGQLTNSFALIQGETDGQVNNLPDVRATASSLLTRKWFFTLKEIYQR